MLQASKPSFIHAKKKHLLNHFNQIQFLLLGNFAKINVTCNQNPLTILVPPQIPGNNTPQDAGPDSWSAQSPGYRLMVWEALRIPRGEKTNTKQGKMPCLASLWWPVFGEKVTSKQRFLKGSRIESFGWWMLCMVIRLYQYSHYGSMILGELKEGKQIVLSFMNG